MWKGEGQYAVENDFTVLIVLSFSSKIKDGRHEVIFADFSKWSDFMKGTHLHGPFDE